MTAIARLNCLRIVSYYLKQLPRPHYSRYHHHSHCLLYLQSICFGLRNRLQLKLEGADCHQHQRLQQLQLHLNASMVDF